ncbi:helix-turn-helix transcriptional regulator [Achromobacter spanius]|uniref:AraC family transcriptional regulator n=1 Tax=Achromobacter spanius TaxID=217203 RepID=A0AA42LPB9_9BURK|nr:AraC family transcriptional regulator [Achromobacter spanius]MDH0737076.1 AraC family transcriptional regulator [Achromobacter spanius]
MRPSIARVGDGGTLPCGSAPRKRSLPITLERQAKTMLLSGQNSVADVARACKLSRTHFTTAFRDAEGTTPHRWVLLQRIAEAREQLRIPNKTLADIALDCGFSDQAHFTRVFHNLVGVPPGAWRRAAKA